MKRLHRNILLLLALLVSGPALLAQSTSRGTTFDELRENLCKTGGVYYAYPAVEAENTPAPKGYEPFYISHYGRHGSRYLISDRDYTWVAELMRKAGKAGALTPLGENVLRRLDSIMPEARGRGGDLSPLGVRQHRGIAERMMKAYPQVFKGSPSISARSTTVVRCVLSMDAFCERLKELNPALKITRESSGRYMDYLNYHSPESNAFTGDNGPWREEYRKFEESHTRPARLVESLFSDSNFVVKNVNPSELMWGLYWIASDMQDMETPVSFYDIFTPDELIDLWQCVNYRFYVCDSSYAGNGGLPVANARNLIRNIVESADSAIRNPATSVTLRFGHDGNLLPLAAILGLDGCDVAVSNPSEFYRHFAEFKIAPMAGNIQLVFVRPARSGKRSGSSVADASDVLVKFLLNEQETAIPHLPRPATYPYYRWPDVKSFLLSR